MSSNELKKEYKYAVIGASKNENKYGYKVLKSLKERSVFVVPINPKEKEILGLKCFKSVEEVDDAKVFVFVTQPNISENIIKNLKNTNKILWLQPGSENDEIIKFCKEKNINCIYRECILINSIK